MNEEFLYCIMKIEPPFLAKPNLNQIYLNLAKESTIVMDPPSEFDLIEVNVRLLKLQDLT